MNNSAGCEERIVYREPVSVLPSLTLKISMFSFNFNQKSALIFLIFDIGEDFVKIKVAQGETQLLCLIELSLVDLTLRLLPLHLGDWEEEGIGRSQQQGLIALQSASNMTELLTEENGLVTAGSETLGLKLFSFKKFKLSRFPVGLQHYMTTYTKL